MTLDTILQAKIYELQAELDSLLVKAAGVETAINALKSIQTQEPVKVCLKQPVKAVSKRRYSRQLVKTKVLEFLRTNSPKEFTLRQLSQVLQIKDGSVSGVLTVLKRDKLVKHRQYSWSAA